MVQFGATLLFKDITFTVARGERWGVIGRNGTGKTTLFRLITGQQEPSAGALPLALLAASPGALACRPVDECFRYRKRGRPEQELRSALPAHAQ